MGVVRIDLNFLFLIVLHIDGVVYVHFSLVLYMLFTLLQTLVEILEEASSSDVFSQIKLRYITFYINLMGYSVPLLITDLKDVVLNSTE